jgi:iron-sulfur cluster assembly accessory protein
MVMVTQTKAGEDLSSQRQAADSASEEVAAEDQNTDTLLIISDSCWKRIHHLAQKKGSSLSVVYLRVFVDAGGCSGFTYQFEIDTDENLEKDDIVFTGPEGARVVVDPGSLEFIKGSTIDYVQEMIKSAFEVRDNPQSESACGCGSSFALKNFEANPAVD